MDCSTPGLPVHHQLPELAHVHWVGDAIQPSHPLSSPSPPTFNLSQHQFFPVSRFFTSGGESIGVSASASVLLMNILDWFPLGWTGCISLQSKGPSRVFSNTTVQKHQFFSDPYITSGKTIALTIQTFVGKVMSLLFHMLSRLVIAFSSKEQVSFNFMTAIAFCSDFGAPQNKVCHCFHCFPISAMRWWDRMPWCLLFECWVWSQIFHSPLSHHQKTL